MRPEQPAAAPPALGGIGHGLLVDRIGAQVIAPIDRCPRAQPDQRDIAADYQQVAIVCLRLERAGAGWTPGFVSALQMDFGDAQRRRVIDRGLDRGLVVGTDSAGGTGLFGRDHWPHEPEIAVVCGFPAECREARRQRRVGLRIRHIDASADAGRGKSGG